MKHRYRPGPLAAVPLVAGILLWSFAGPAAFAQSGPQGVAFAQAEEGVWSCRGDDAMTALNCARTACETEGGGQECFRTAWCYPSGWAGILTVTLPDFHTNHAMCGAPTLQGLLDAMRAFCDASPDAQSCDVSNVTGPDGTANDTVATWAPAPATPVKP